MKTDNLKITVSQDDIESNINNQSNNQSNKQSSNQSNKQSNDQSIDQSKERGRIRHPLDPINQSDQPIKLQIPSNNPRHYNVIGPHSPESIHLPKTLFTSQSINQSINQPTSPLNQQTSNRSNLHSISIESPNVETKANSSNNHNQSNNQSNNQPNNQSIKQSIKYSEDHSDDSFCSIIHRLFQEDLPNIFKPNPIRRKFSRQLNVALKIVIAFIACSIIAVQSIAHSSEILALPYLSVLFVMLVAKQSIGEMMNVIDSQLKGVCAAVVIDCCLIAVGVPAIRSRTIRIICVQLLMFFTSFCLAYRFRTPAARRYSLAVHGMSCIAMTNNPNVAIYYPLQLLLSLLIAFVFSIVVAGLPFPRLAKDELLDRYRLTAASLSRTFSLLIKASLSVEPVLPDILRARAQLELQHCAQLLAHMRRLEKAAVFESDIWRILFPLSISLGSSVTPDIDRFELLCWDLRSFHHCLKRVRYQSDYHAHYARYMRPGLGKLDQAQKAFFSLIYNEDKIVLTQQSVDLRKQQLSSATQLATRNFLAARDHTYGYDFIEKDSSSDIDSPITRTSSSIHQPSQSRLGLRRVSSKNFLDTVQEENVNHRKRAHSQSDECRLISPFTHSTDEYFLRSSVFFCVLRFQSIMQNLELCPASDVMAACPSNTSDHVTQWDIRISAIRHMVQNIFQRPWECSLLGLHPLSDFHSLLSDVVNFLVHPKVDLVWFRSSLKVALIICTSSLVSVIPQVVDSGMLPNSVWSLWTAAVVISETEGGLYERSMFRLFGTFIGGAVGYLVVLAFPCQFVGPDLGLSHQVSQCTSWTGSVALLAFWIFLMSIVQESRYSYLGTMAGFSSIVIVFGVVVNNPARLSAAEYSVARQVEIYIGVIVALIISCSIYPTNSIHLLRAEFANCCDQILQAVNETVTFYQTVINSPQYSNLFTQPSDPLPQCDALDVDETTLLTSISAHSTIISKSLAYQSLLIESAKYEPTALFRPFSVPKHKDVSHLIRIVWMTMALVESAVRAICKADRDLIASTDETAHVELLQLTEYNGVLRGLISQVSALVNSCILFLQNIDSGFGSSEQTLVHMTLSERVDATANQVMRSSHFIQSRFAHSLNSIVNNVRSGQCKPPPVELMVPIAVFLSSCIQCSQLAVRLVQAVGTLQHKNKDPEYEE